MLPILYIFICTCILLNVQYFQCACLKSPRGRRLRQPRSHGAPKHSAWAASISATVGHLSCSPTSANHWATAALAASKAGCGHGVLLPNRACSCANDRLRSTTCGISKMEIPSPPKPTNLRLSLEARLRQPLPLVFQRGGKNL